MRSSIGCALIPQAQIANLALCPYQERSITTPRHPLWQIREAKEAEMRATKTDVRKQLISVALLPLLPLIVVGCTPADQDASKGQGIKEQISQNASEVKKDVTTWGLRAATWINSTARLNDLTNKTAQAISEGLLSRARQSACTPLCNLLSKNRSDWTLYPVKPSSTIGRNFSAT